MKFLVLDNGIFVEQAAALAAGGKNQVKYYTPWQSTFPKYSEYAVGKYFDHLEKVYYFWEWVDWADCIVNFDVANNDAIGWLRDKYPEKGIYGSGWGQKLEDDRVLLKKLIHSFRLPEQKYEVVYGLKNLREYLKNNKDVYVKLNRFRTDAESFYSPDYESVVMKLNMLETVLGPHANDDDPKVAFPFIVEECIDADVEIGFDGFFNGTDYGSHAFVGYEYHKGPYIACATEIDSLPAPLAETMDCWQDVLRKINYRGALSTEEKIKSEKEHYFLDICGRLPAPLSALYPEYIKNWPEVIYNISKGLPFELDIKHKYVAAMPFTSEEARVNYVKINLADRKVGKLQMGCGDKDGNYYAVKGLEVAAIAIGGGNTVEEAIESLANSTKTVDGIDLNKDAMGGIELKFKELIEKGRKVGIHFT